MKRKESSVKTKPANDTAMNIKEIENLIKFVQNSGVAEVSLEQKDFKLTIRTTHGSTIVASTQHHMVAAPQIQHAPAPAAAPVAPSAESSKSADESKYITIKSP